MQKGSSQLKCLGLCWMLGIVLARAAREVVVASRSSDMKAHYRCDGIKDEETIKEAVAKASSNKKGGIVTLSDGIFNIYSNVELTSGTTLQGQGMYKTVLRVKAKSPRWNSSGIIRGTNGSKNLKVRDLTIDGNRRQQGNDSASQYGKVGFYCQTCINVKLSKVRVKSCNGYGIDPHGKAGRTEHSKGFVLENSVIEDNGKDGVTIDKTRDVRIQNNIIRNNLRHGVNIVTGSRYVAITGNRIRSAASGDFEGCGVMVQNNGFFNTSYVTIRNNNMKMSNTHGVCVVDSDHVRVQNNTITGTGSTRCIKFTDSNFGSVYANNCSDRDVKVKVELTGDYNAATFSIKWTGNVKYSK